MSPAIVDERTPLAPISDLKTTTLSNTTTPFNTTPLQTASDTKLNRPSSEATVQAYTPSTTPTSLSSILLQSESRTTRTATDVSVQSDGHRLDEHLLDEFLLDEHQALDIIMASTRHANRNLEPGQRSSPPKPSAWHESVHHDQLVRVYDAVVEATARNPKYSKCITSQVGSTLNAMLKRCPELAGGRVPLTQDWIEYVLGKALRQPFNNAAMMGRWEILASSGGARGMWGPW